MKNLWTIIETCMVDGLEFTTWANLWMTFPQPNAMAAMAAMACRAQGCFHRWTCPVLRWAHWTSIPSAHGIYGYPWIGCHPNIQSFSQFFLWGHMKLTSIQHRFPQHFPMKAPQKRPPLRSPLMMLEWAAWIRAWVCTDVRIWSRRRERRSWIGFNGTMIYYDGI